MRIKKIYWGNWHVFSCDICWQMERRGYDNEGKYWKDNFDNKLKPVKYKLVKAKRTK
jgi:hypothetical protein